jgi:PST family polysaccharide transporter
LRDLKRTAITGFFWQSFGAIGQKGAVFIATLVLARFLTREDFGVVGVALSIVAILELIRDGGIAQALIAYKGDEKPAVPTAFWMVFVPGAIYCFALIAFADQIEAWFQFDRLAPILRAMAVTQILDAMRVIPNAMLGRTHRFRDRAIADTGAVVFGVVVALISLALLPPEQRIWSLALMWIARFLAAATLFNLFYPVLPRRVFDRQVARDLAKGGRRMLMSNIPSGTLEYVSTVIIGRRIGELGTGLYRMATSLTTPPLLLGHSANSTLFPILSKSTEERERFNDMVVRSMRSVGVIAFSVLTYLAVTAHDLVPIVLGAKWTPAIEATRWMCLAVAFRILTFFCTSTLLASGRHAYAAATWWATFVVGIGLLIGVALPTGDGTRAAVMTAAYSVFGGALGFVLLAQGLGVGGVRLLAALAPAALSSAAGALAGWAAYGFVGQGLGRPAAFALATAAFVVVFLPVCGKTLGVGWRDLFSSAGWKAMLKAS